MWRAKRGKTECKPNPKSWAKLSFRKKQID